MESSDFLKPRFTGRRFDDHTLPFDLLVDISAYQELLLQVAKDIYYEQNGTRRVPNGFGQGVYLKLAQVNEGSSIPEIMLAASTFFAGSLDTPLDTRPYFDQAKDKIANTIQVAADDGDISSMLSPESFTFFNKIGKNLLPDESIEFNPNSPYTAKLTQTNRRKIALASPDITTIESLIKVRGIIKGISKNPYEFILETKDKKQFRVQIDEDKYPIVKKAYEGYEENQKVLVSCIGVFGKQNKLESIKEVQYTVLLSTLDVPSIIENYVNLEQGWMDGDGESFAPNDLNWLSTQFDNYYSPTLIVPHTYPTIDGGIRFEWVQEEYDTSLEINLKDKTGYLHYYNSSSNEDSEDELNLSTPDAWEKLNELLSNFYKNTP